MIRPFHPVDTRDPETAVVRWAGLQPGDLGMAYELPAGAHAATITMSGEIPDGTVAGFVFSLDGKNFDRLRDTAGNVIANPVGVVHVGPPLPKFIRPGIDFRGPAGAAVTFELHVAFRQPAPVREAAENVVSLNPA